MKSSHKKSAGAIVIITILLVLVTIMDTLMVFNMTREQTKESGAYQLLSISGKLEGTINDAEKRTMQIAVTAQELLDDKQTLESFIYNMKKELLNEGKGALNIYIAGPGWDIIPDFADRSPDFVATERTWYTGARRKRGGTNVTPPYVDVVTGQICYTISVMLADNETVLGIDYTMDPIREHIMQMYENGSREAAIVTGEGIIAGCSDDMLVRQSLNDAIPKYDRFGKRLDALPEIISAAFSDPYIKHHAFCGDHSALFLHYAQPSEGRRCAGFKRSVLKRHQRRA